MLQHVLAGGQSRPRRAMATLVEWHDSRPRASLADARGWIWLALVAATFVWMSNPLVYFPSFYLSLGEAMVWSKVVLVLSLPWLRLPRIPWPWLAFLGLALISHRWSIQPFHTEVSSTVYIQIAVLAVLAAANCEPVVIAWGMTVGGVSVTLLSLHALSEDVPGIEYSSESGMVFGGLGTNENILAYTLLVSLAATLALGRPRERVPQAMWFGALAIQLYGTYRAGSGTGYLTALGLAVTVTAILGWPLVRTARRRIVVAFMAGGVAVLATGLLFVTVVLGKELTTISGRAPFWRATIDSSMDLAPVLGAGWGAVWEHPWDPAPPNHIALDIYYRAGYPLPHGHNFFLDVLPELGLVGLAAVLVMVAYVVREIRWAGLHAGWSDPVAGRLMLLVLIALLVSGITEPMLTVPLGWWSLALVAALPRQRLLRWGRPPRARRGRRAAALSPAASRSTPATTPPRHAG